MMLSISPFADTRSTASAPRVFHGLAYGVLASLMLWLMIAAAIIKLA
jgi:hypothetical protein